MNKALTRAAARAESRGVSSFWDLLRGSDGIFESTVKGTSMEPTIPDGSRVRIRPQTIQDYQVGQIIACVLKDEIFAHRIVHCAPGTRAQDAVITLGDSHALCDPPTRKGDILGRVTEFSKDGEWRVPESRANRTPMRHAVSVMHRFLIWRCLQVHFELAWRVAGTSLIIGSWVHRGRALLGRSRTRP